MNDSLIEKDPKCSPLKKIIVVASIATGIQFSWALQFSLLTPYVQLLHIPHSWASLIWLCGPISGMLVQPIVGHQSDRCTSRFGRRRPFIAAGTASLAVAVFLISFAADIGHLSGDEIGKTPKTRAIAVFVIGFWILDIANNMLEAPCRALLADLAGSNQQHTRTGYALYTFFMSVGYVLGYAAGSYNHLRQILPFTITEACDVDCANLKTCFFIAILLLSILTFIALTYVKEKQWSPAAAEAMLVPYSGEIWVVAKKIRRPMWILLMVTCLNATAFFPYLLYNTDWMAREVYGGDSRGSPEEVELYELGVHVGAIGLMFGAVVLGFTSLGIEMVARRLGKVKGLWSVANFVLAVCLGSTVLIARLAESNRAHAIVSNIIFTAPSPPSGGITAAALALFAIMGIPQAALSSIPYALASMFSKNSGVGQGLCMGVVNLSHVIPQIVLSLTSGPFDALFGGGNLPSFVVGAIAATASGILALTLLPSPPPDAPTS